MSTQESPEQQAERIASQMGALARVGEAVESSAGRGPVPEIFRCPSDPYGEVRCAPGERDTGDLASLLAYDGRKGDFGVDVALRRCRRCSTPLVGIAGHGEVEDSVNDPVLWVRFPAAEIGEDA